MWGSRFRCSCASKRRIRGTIWPISSNKSSAASPST
jgi:hypothetical protein